MWCYVKYQAIKRKRFYEEKERVHMVRQFNTIVIYRDVIVKLSQIFLMCGLRLTLTTCRVSPEKGFN